MDAKQQRIEVATGERVKIGDTWVTVDNVSRHRQGRDSPSIDVVEMTIETDAPVIRAKVAS